MKTGMLVCILVFGISTQYGIADDYDWPRWRGPNGYGVSLETDWDPKALAGGPKILWKVDVGFGYSSVVIKDNRLYTMGLGGVYCFHVDTGEEIWLHSLESTDDTLATPTTDGKYVCILEKEGVLSCLKAKKRTLLWEKDLVSVYDVETPFYYFAASPVIEGDLVILTANTSGLALNKKTGKKVWGSEKPPESTIALFKETAVGDFETTGVDYSTPVLYEQEGKRYAILSSYKGMHAVDVETGEVLWLYEWDLYGGTGHKIDPLIFDNKVLIGGVTFNEVDCGIVLLNISRKDPEALWTSLNMDSNISSPVLVDGYIYGSHGGL
jgi:outer membrane protein assembly factor BamB